jgi:hypothetical protein
MSSEEDPTTKELRIAQTRKETAEREAAEQGSSDFDTDTHDARAAKAAYLRKKLEDRAEAERKAEED